MLYHKKICIGSDFRSLLYSYLNNYYFIPYQYFHSIPCDYYENIDFVFKSNSKSYERYKRRLLKTIKINKEKKNIYLKSDMEDMLFNILGNRGQIMSIPNMKSYEFSYVNKLKFNFIHMKKNIHIKFDEVVLIDPIEIDDFIYFEYDIIDTDLNNVYMFYKLKKSRASYNESKIVKFDHIIETDDIFPQKMYYGDYKKLNFKYVTLFGVLSDVQLQNDVLLHEDRLLEYSIAKLIGEKEMKKNLGREKQFAQFIGRSIIPFSKFIYKDQELIKFIYKTDEEIIQEYLNGRKIITTKDI